MRTAPTDLFWSKDFSQFSISLINTNLGGFLGVYFEVGEEVVTLPSLSKTR